MDVVTALIEPTEGGLYGWYQGTSGNIDKSFFRGVYVPDEPYRVIYMLSPRGKLRVRQDLTWCSPLIGQRPVCFLPRSWIGKRVNRYVVPLSAGRRRK